MGLFDADLSRRQVLKSAVAIGGASALSACLDRGGSEPVPSGDPDAKPTRQHAWREYIRQDEHGNSQLPNHQLLLYVNLDEDSAPSADARKTLEDALAVLDRAYAWSHEGLVHSIAYSPAYFDRFDASLPEGIDLPEPTALSPFESPTFDRQDALLHLASDRPDALLEADRALRSERDSANGVSIPPLTDALTVDSRRTGFVGAGKRRRSNQGEDQVNSAHVEEGSPRSVYWESSLGVF